MQRMQACHFKFRERRNDWRCCFCCHVRTGTIFFGIWHLMLHVLALSVIAVVLSHPELMVGSEDEVMNVPPALPTPLSEVDFENNMDVDIQLTLGHAPVKPFTLHPHTLRGDFFGHRTFEYKDINCGVVVTFCTFIITLLMVFGAIKGKPSYLMPFFCLQVFDFAISSLTAIGYICYLPDVHRVVTESPRVPFQSELLRMNPQSLSMLILLTFMLAMLVKAYFIGVVWGCYKYLTLRQITARRTIHYIDTDVQTLLPDYETAVKKFPPPPPSYANAMSGQVISPPPTSMDNPPPPV